MIIIHNYIYEGSFDSRKRFRRDLLKQGDIVAYKSKGGYDAWGSYQNPDYGFLIVEKEDAFPDQMSFYEASSDEKQRVNMAYIQRFITKDREDGKTLEDILIEMIKASDDQDYVSMRNLQERLMSLPYFIVTNEECKDFSRNVWAKCKDQIGAVGIGFNKTKAVLYTMLVAVSMIIGSEHSSDTKIELTNQLNQQWYNFSVMYSLFYGRNISTDHYKFIELISYVLDRKRNENYLHLYVMALGDVPTKIAKILRYSPNENRVKLADKIDVLKRQCALVAPKDDLDMLFETLFPQSFQRYLTEDNPYATIQEMQEALKGSEETRKVLQKVEAYAQYLKTELDDAIKMQELKKLFDKLDADTSWAIFAQFDMVLEGKNAVWDKHRLELKEQINIRHEARKQITQHVHQAGSTYNDNSRTLQIGAVPPAADMNQIMQNYEPALLC